MIDALEEILYLADNMRGNEDRLTKADYKHYREDLEKIAVRAIVAYCRDSVGTIWPECNKDRVRLWYFGRYADEEIVLEALRRTKCTCCLNTMLYGACCDSERRKYTGEIVRAGADWCVDCGANGIHIHKQFDHWSKYLLICRFVFEKDPLSQIKRAYLACVPEGYWQSICSREA
jgi:hypothetical protein